MPRNLGLVALGVLASLSISSIGFPEPSKPTPTRTRGPTRIDFDDRLVQGQANTSGAVYLLDRKKSRIRSMVRTRVSFRHLTLRTVYDR